MQCGNCGTENIKDAAFCINCGTSLKQEQQPRRGPPNQYQPVQRLYRSREDRMIAGVCGGLARYFNVDSNLVRALFVLFTFTGGAGIFAYIILIVLIPESPMDPWKENM